MSSPTVLIATRVPALVARSRNRDQIDVWLAETQSLYKFLLKMSADTVAAGGQPLAPGVMSFEEARCRTEALFASGSDAGWSAVTFLHAYWQSLKHNDLDSALKCYAATTTAVHTQAAEEQERVSAFVAEVLTGIQAGIRVDARQSTTVSAGPMFQWNEILLQNLKAIARHSDPSQVEEIKRRVAAMAGAPRGERIIALEALRLSIEQDAKLRQERAALLAFQQKQAELAAEVLTLQLTRCAALTEALDLPQEHAAVAELQGLSAESREPGFDKLKQRVAALEETLLAEKSRQGLLQATIQSLRRQGYERVEVMATLNPGDIRPVYLADPHDPDRLTLLMVDEDEGLVAAEVVSRAPVRESQLMRQLDLDAQKRLCKAMDAAQQLVAERWSCEVERTLPGKPVKADARLAHIIPAQQRHGQRPQEQARRLP